MVGHPKVAGGLHNAMGGLESKAARHWTKSRAVVGPVQPWEDHVETRPTTKWAIGLLIGWIVLNIIANAAAPRDLPGRLGGTDERDFVSAVQTANFFQGIGTLCLLIGLVCGGVSIYKNVMEKQLSKTVYGPNVEHSPGAAVATHNATAVAGGGVVAAHSSKIDYTKGDEINHNLSTISEFVNNSKINDDDRRRAKLIIDHLRNNNATSGDSQKHQDSAFHLADLAKMLESVGAISPAVKSAIEILKHAFGAQVST